MAWAAVERVGAWAVEKAVEVIEAAVDLAAREVLAHPQRRRRSRQRQRTRVRRSRIESIHFPLKLHCMPF